MNWPVRLVGLSLLTAMTVLSHAQLTTSERKKLDDALFIRNLASQSLKSPRFRSGSPKPLPLIQSALDDPLGTTDKLLEAHTSAGTGTTVDLLVRAMRLANPEVEVGGAAVQPPVKITILRGAIRDALASLVPSMLATNDEIASALGRLQPNERPVLARGLLRLALDNGAGANAEENRRTRTLLSKVDLERIKNASVGLLAAVEDAASLLSRSSDDVPSNTLVTINGLRVLITPKRGSAIDISDADLVLALGGRNSFSGQAASGVMKSSVVIDLGQSSNYDMGDRSLGCGLLGVGIAYIKSGDSDFRAGDASLGCGIGGVGVFYKEGGDDIYRSGSMTQWFGESGIGLCVDTAGSDHWNCLSWGQGAARTDGIGWLVDRSGTDVFRSTGIADLSTVRGVKVSASQGYSGGYGLGIADAPGGIGLLTALGSDHAFEAESRAQGSSSWLSVGSLFAKSGAGSYSSRDLSQGTSMHQSFAMLVDGGADTTYVTAKGAGHAASFDESISVLVDRGGNDRIFGGEAPIGFTDDSSLSLRIKSEGAWTTVGQENAVNQLPAGSGSLVAEPVMASRLEPGVTRARLAARWFDGDFGLAEKSPGGAATGVAIDPGQIAQAWDGALQGSGANFDTIWRSPRQSLEWAVRNRLSTGTAADRQLATRLALYLGDAAGPAFASLVVSEDEAQLRQCMLVAGLARVQDVSAVIPRLVANHPNLRVEAAELAGRLRSHTSVQSLLILLVDSDVRVSRAAMGALASIGDESSVGSAQAMLTSEDITTREAAIRLLAEFPSQAGVAARTLIDSGEESRTRTALVLLSRVGSPEALIQVAASLRDSRPGVRITALQELSGRFPPSSRGTAQSLVNDSDERVRNVAKAVRIG